MMNERIKELAFLAAEKTNSKFDCDKVWMEKFAKLIVQEVLTYQETLVSEGHNAWHLNDQTKKHFGVEE